MYELPVGMIMRGDHFSIRSADCRGDIAQPPDAGSSANGWLPFRAKAPRDQDAKEERTETLAADEQMEVARVMFLLRPSGFICGRTHSSLASWSLGATARDRAKK